MSLSFLGFSGRRRQRKTGGFGQPQPQAKQLKRRAKRHQTLLLEHRLTLMGLTDTGDDTPDTTNLDILAQLTPSDDGDGDSLALGDGDSPSSGPVDGNTFGDGIGDDPFDGDLVTEPDATLGGDGGDDLLPNLDEIDYDGLLSDLTADIDFAFDSGYFTVGDSGEVTIDFLFDGGFYRGELAMFSLEGMDEFELGSEAYIREAARRSLSGSDLGHVVISDQVEGARFSGLMAGENQNWNSGDYLGPKTFQMKAGDRFGFMLVPNGRVQQVLNNPAATGALRPLFSMATANPDDMFAMGQIADVFGDGNTFAFEDKRIDQGSDLDYNDLVFQVRGATSEALALDHLVDPAKDWRATDLGQAVYTYALSFVDTGLDGWDIDFTAPPEAQPLIGIIDTGFASDNPDIDYSRITFGRDWVDGDDNPLFAPGEGDGHGTFVLGKIAATRDNGIGIDGINDQAPLWLGRAVGSGQWANSLTEFVDAAIASGQPNAVVNLSFDLTQVDAEGNVFTRYELTPQERAAIEYARQNGVLIVAAAGNDGGVMSALGQASQEFDNIITVGAAALASFSVGSAKDHERAEYSSYGFGLDILAPGGTAKDPKVSLGGDSISLMAGTSVAAAKVTGAISQVWAANPALSYRQVIEIIKETAIDLNTPGWDPETGAGLLNMAAAVALAKVTNPAIYEVPDIEIGDDWSDEGLFTAKERAVNLNEALSFTLRWEGGFVNHPNDPGGATNKGIIQTTYDTYRQKKGLARRSVQQITDAEAREIYETMYWLASGSNTLQRPLNIVHFDTAVNMGVGGASTLLSQARASSDGTTSSIVRRYLDLREARYRELAKNNAKLSVFLQGWLNRLNDLRKTVEPMLSQPISSSNPVVSSTTVYRPYVVRSGDTLWAIAQRELGNGNLWRNIINPNTGRAFTEAEARLLQPNTTIKLPVVKQVGTGTSFIPQPTPVPSPKNPPDRAGGSFATALNLGDLTGRRIQSVEAIGIPYGDRHDFFRFTVNDNRHFQASLTEMTAAAGLTLFKADGTPVPLNTSALNNSAFDKYFSTHLPAGTYFAAVNAPQDTTKATNYRLTLNLLNQSPGVVPAKPQNHLLRPSGQNLVFRPGQTWETASGYQFTFQADGNLVLRGTSGQVLWATGSEGMNATRLIVQTDGNIVLYDGNNRPIWATNTAGNPGAYFAIQGDGNLVVYSSDGRRALYASSTNNNQRRTVIAATEWIRDRNLRRFPNLPSSTVISVATGKALDSGGANNSVYPHPSPNPANAFHRWGLHKVGDFYMLIDLATGRALSPNGTGTATPYTHLDPQVGNLEQHWRLVPVGDSYMIINRVTGHALDSGGANGNQIYMHPTPFDWNGFHKWKLTLPTTEKPGHVNGEVGSIPLNMRTGPGMNHSLIRQLSRGTNVTILRTVTGGSYPVSGGSRSDWHEIRVGNQTGFVAAHYISNGHVSTPTPQPIPNPSGAQRILDAVERVNPDQWYYRPRDITGDGRNETFCNWFVADVLEVLGVPIPRHNQPMYPPVFGGNPRNKPLQADQLFDSFVSSNRWRSVTAAEAVNLANQGRVVIASSRPNFGHIAIVIPGGSGSNVRIAQAGAVNGKNMSVKDGFGSITPSYFVYT